jgi:hypothetical protein
MKKIFSNLGNRAAYNQLNRNQYLCVALFLLLFILVVVLLTLEIKHFSNTFGVKQMVLISLFAGCLLGLGLWWNIVREKPEMELLTKFQLSLALIISGMILMPPIVSFTNRTLSFSERQQVPVIFYKAEGYYSSRFGRLPQSKPDGYYVFFVKDNQLERIKVKENPYQDAEGDSQVLLPVKRGLWGFEYVDF